MEQYQYNQYQDNHSQPQVSQSTGNPYGNTYGTGAGETKSRKGLIAAIAVACTALIAAVVMVVLLFTGVIGSKNRIASAQTSSRKPSSSHTASSGSGSMRSRIISDLDASTKDADAKTADSKEHATGADAGKTQAGDSVTADDVTGYYLITDLMIDGRYLGESEITETGIEVQLAFLPGGEGWIAENLDGYRSVRPMEWTTSTFCATGYAVRNFTWEDGVMTVTDPTVPDMAMVLVKQEGDIPERPLSELRDNAFGIGNLTEESEIRVTVRVAGTQTWQERNSTDVLPYGTMTTADIADLGDARFFDVRVEMTDLNDVTYYYYNVEMANGYNLMIVSDDDGNGGYTKPLAAAISIENGSYDIIASYVAE